MPEESKRGSKGGDARAAKLTKEQRSAIAKDAAKKRWAKKENGTSAEVAILGNIAPIDFSKIGAISEEYSSNPVPIFTIPEAPKATEAQIEPPPAPRPSPPSPAEKGRRRAAKEKPVSKVYRQALSIAEKEYAETIEELAFHDGMAARLNAKLPRLIQTIQALGGTIDPQASVIQAYHPMMNGVSHHPQQPALNYPPPPDQMPPQTFDPALFATNNGPLPGLAPAIAHIPLVPNKPVGGAIDLGYTPVDEEGPALPKIGGDWR